MPNRELDLHKSPAQDDPESAQTKTSRAFLPQLRTCVCGCNSIVSPSARPRAPRLAQPRAALPGLAADVCCTLCRLGQPHQFLHVVLVHISRGQPIINHIHDDQIK